MSFLKRLGKTFASGQREDADALWVYVRCRRCGEAIGTRISLRNDLSIHYGETGQPSGYHARKVLVGGQRRCYQPLEIHLTFDAGRRLLEREISGGEFITAEEYAAE
ncbi:MAG: hypothetical protein H8D78_20095 [Chloroflexi bacterium]|nr:hypothetical protein [Chloroflexota bacterium]